MSTNGIGSGGGGLYGLDPFEQAQEDAKTERAKQQDVPLTEGTANVEGTPPPVSTQGTGTTQSSSSTDGIDPVGSSSAGAPSVSPGDGNQPLLADAAPAPGTSPADNASSGAVTYSDANSIIGAGEDAINVAYAKIMNETKNDVEALKQMIADITQQVERLKEKADKLEKVSHEIAALLPEFMNALDSDKQGPFCARDPNQMTAQEQQLADHLKTILSEAGITVKDGTLESLVNAIGEGGQAGMALAIALCMSIAELVVDAKSGTLNGTPNAGKEEIAAAGPDGEAPATDPAAVDPALDPNAEPVFQDKAAPLTEELETGLLIEPRLSEADAFAAKLEGLAVAAQQYVEANPYDGAFFLATWSNVNDPTSSQGLAGNALMAAVFGDGTAVSTQAVASSKRGDVVNIEGFQIDMVQVTIASMMPKDMASTYVAGLIASQLAGKLAEIDVAVKGLQKLQLALVDLIKLLEKDLVTTSEEKDKAIRELQKAKAKALSSISTIVDEMRARNEEMKAQLVHQTSTAAAGLFGFAGEILTETAQASASLR